MKISCDKALDICNKAQYNEASKWDVFKLKIHTFFCTTCSKHSKNNTMLTGICANLHALEEADKESMKEALKRDLKESSTQ